MSAHFSRCSTRATGGCDSSCWEHPPASQLQHSRCWKHTTLQQRPTSPCTLQWNGRTPLCMGILFPALQRSSKGKSTFKNTLRKIRHNWGKAAVRSVYQNLDRSADLSHFLQSLAEFLKKLLIISFCFPCLALSLSSSNPDGFQHLTIAPPTQYSRNDQEIRGAVRRSASWAAC